MYYCDVERDCPQADGDKPAGDWATSHGSVHDDLVNKKSNAMRVKNFGETTTEDGHKVFFSGRGYSNKNGSGLPSVLLSRRPTPFYRSMCSHFYACGICVFP